MAGSKIVLELTSREAEIIKRAIQGYSPPKEDEMLSFMLFNRLEKIINQNENK